MIIYGSKATELKTENITGKCPHCATPGSIQMIVFQKYAHIFWIPFFPTGKTGVTSCSHCKQVLQKKEFDTSLSENYETLKVKTKTPAWTFSGLVILILLIGWGIVQSNQHDARNAKIILAPQKGDIYEIKSGFTQYTLYKVDSVAGDTVYLLTSQYETSKLSGLREIKNKGDEAYNEDVLPLLKSDLKTMLDKGEIADIDRK